MKSTLLYATAKCWTSRTGHRALKAGETIPSMNNQIEMACLWTILCAVGDSQIAAIARTLIVVRRQT